MRSRHLRLRWEFAALVVLVALVAVLCGANMLLMLAPVAALAAPLALGRYPGERLIRRLTRTTTVPRAPRRIRLPRAPRCLSANCSPLAVAGASRAPPIAAVA